MSRIESFVHREVSEKGTIDIHRLQLMPRQVICRNKVYCSNCDSIFFCFVTPVPGRVRIQKNRTHRHGVLVWLHRKWPKWPSLRHQNFNPEPSLKYSFAGTKYVNNRAVQCFDSHSLNINYLTSTSASAYIPTLLSMTTSKQSSFSFEYSISSLLWIAVLLIGVPSPTRGKRSCLLLPSSQWLLF